MKPKNYINLFMDIGELDLVLSSAKDVESMLQKVVDVIVKHIPAEIGSIYIYEEEKQSLILKATKGLPESSIGNIKLKIGQGLAGSSLKQMLPICTDDGFTHPDFEHIPGIDEEYYKAFLVVPILRGITRIGVITLQRKTKSSFSSDDTMALRAIASQVATLIENAKLLLTNPAVNGLTKTTESLVSKSPIKGRLASNGFAYAPGIVFHKDTSYLSLKDYAFKERYPASSFDNALNLTESQLNLMQKKVEEKLSDAASLIFATHLMILKDNGFTGRIRKLIFDGINPPNAVLSIGKEYIEKFLSMKDAYFKEKAQDVSDLILRIIANIKDPKPIGDTSLHCIVIASELYPSDMLVLSSNDTEGIVVTSGGITSHVAILARSLGIPMIIVNDREFLNIGPNTNILIDAEAENVYVNPSEKIVKQFKQSKASYENIVNNFKHNNRAPVTKDGQSIRLLANINLLRDLHVLQKIPCDGIGLYRTEFPFLLRKSFPTEEEQYSVYKKLVDTIKGKEVTFRTLDVGGDKVLSYYDVQKESNPFLGMRSIRFSLKNRDIFRQQIRAILRAGYNAKLRIMFPMISSIEEFIESKKEVTKCISELKKNGILCNETPLVGMMVEIPAVINIIESFAKIVDFFSIGSNDLIQYMLAADRTNEKVSEYYVPHHPSIISALNSVSKASEKFKKDISICGDMAHNTMYTALLLGLGINSISVDPMYIPKVYNEISKIKISDAYKLADKICSLSTANDIEKALLTG